MSAIEKHLAAIKSGQVTKTNIIGIRKALNAFDRERQGWSTSRTSPKVNLGDVRALHDALERYAPIVRGDMHASGVRLLTAPRYRKAFAPVADKIAALQGFSLVGYHDNGDGQHTPIFEAWGNAGSFEFYHIPWQRAAYSGEEAGVHLL